MSRGALVKLRQDARAILDAALTAVDAGNAVRRAWRRALAGFELKEYDRIFLLAAGKAAAAMGGAVEELLGPRLTAGLAITKHGHAGERALRLCAVREAGHPVPDEAGLEAVEAAEAMLRELNARDLLIVALSGGASALLSAPVDGLTLKDKQQTTKLLLQAGANIRELNAVRKHLSRLKGGRLAALAYPAQVVTLVLSDVIGDPLDVIGSGPTAPDPTTFGDALAVLDRFALRERVPKRVRAHLERGAGETPKPGEPFFSEVRHVVIGNNRLALEAAREKARELGYRPLILTSAMEGEAKELGRLHGAMLREAVERGDPVRPPACLLSGGEPTVTVRGHGKGGRAQEFALGAAVALDGVSGCLVLAAGTDGTDGPTDAAGAWVDGETMGKAAQRGLDYGAVLADNDAYTFFAALGQLVKTGPTGTNVMDLAICLAAGRGQTSEETSAGALAPTLKPRQARRRLL